MDNEELNDLLGRGKGDPDFYGYPNEDIEFLNKIDRGFVGLTKPHVQVAKQEDDPHSYQKWAGARKFGISINDMADEPDEMSDHSDDQGWDEHNE